MEKWRLVMNAPQEGAWNMAVDEAILEFVGRNESPPTLRLFDWNPYTLSLGHAQPVSDVDMASLSELGWGLVRRPTGGRAILHADELTYSICANLDNPIVSGNVIDSYRRISKGLLKALELLDIRADSKPKKESAKKISDHPICFQYPSDYEITYQSKKLIGSAQVRKKNAILQHGAIPLFGEITRILRVLRSDGLNSEQDASTQLQSRATTMEETLGRRLTWSKMAESIIQGFAIAHNIEFFHASLTKGELMRAVQIRKEKYANPEWTNRI